MKKLFIFMLITVFSLSCLTGCGDDTANEPVNNEEEVIQEDLEEEQEEQGEQEEFTLPKLSYRTITLADPAASINFEVTYTEDAFYLTDDMKYMAIFEILQFPEGYRIQYDKAGVELPDEFKAWDAEEFIETFVVYKDNTNAQQTRDIYSETADNVQYYSAIRNAVINGENFYAFDYITNGKVVTTYFVKEVQGHSLIIGINTQNPANAEKICSLFFDSCKVVAK